MHNDDTSSKEVYEMSDASAKGIVIVGIGLTFLAVLSGISGYFALKYYTEARPAMSDYVKSPLAGEHMDWTGYVRLQPDPAAELKVHMSDETQAMHVYGKTSEDPPIYRIPVETAIDIIVQNEKLPKFTALGFVPEIEEE